MDITAIIVALIGGLLGGGTIASILDHRNRQRLAESQAKHSDIEAACKLIEQLEKRVERLSARVQYLENQLEERDDRMAAIKKEYNQRIDELEEEIDELRKIMREHGITPPPRRRPARKVE